MFFLFFQIRLLDIVDIVLVAVLLYQLYALIRGTGAMHIFFGILSIYVLWWLVRLFEMDLLSAILGQFVSVGVLALIIVFQPEIRKFLILLGTRSFLNKRSRSMLNKFWKFDQEHRLNISAIVHACEHMAESHTGALIVIAKDNTLDIFQGTGQMLQATVSEAILETIFFKNSPLHDGAVIIADNQVKAARCVLPVSDNASIPAGLGLRHRAALGITEQSDAIALIISEQSGIISWAHHGELQMDIKPFQLKEMLAREYASAR